MSLSVSCYPQPGKPKSRRLCEAFAAGCGGAVVETSGLQTGAAAFYGVVGLERLFQEARRAAPAWYYLDNAYFDCARATHFRVGHSALQASGRETPAPERLKALGVQVRPWQRSGRHVLVVAQSDHFMRQVAGYSGGAAGWQEDVLTVLRRYTDRPLVVRHWQRDKAEAMRTLQQDLKNAWALVTHTSAAANEALLAGIPVFLTGLGAALPMALSQLQSIEYPRRAEGREAWAAALAGQQWTIEEIRAGIAWQVLRGVF